MTDGYLKESASIRELSRIPGNICGAMSEELKRRIERREAVDRGKHMVRVDKDTWLLISPKNNNKRYIAKWRKLANRDKGCLAAKVDEEQMGVEED